MNNKKIIQKQNNDLSGKMLLIALAIITVAFLIYTPLAIIRPWDVKSFSDLNKTSEATVLDENGNSKNEYYVFIYQKDSYKLDLLENDLIKYANYAKHTKDARPIYVIDFSYNFSTNIKDILKYKEEDLETNLPTLILIQNKKASSLTYKTVSTIKSELYNNYK